MSTLSKASELLLKIKKEPVDFSENSHSLLANAKSAYRQSTLDSPDYANTKAIINQYKRKATTEFSEHLQKYRKLELFDNERFRYFDSLDNGKRDEHIVSENGDGLKQSYVASREKKYECVLCNDKFLTEDDRMLHVTLVHKSKSNATKRPYTRFARHTCQICFARFRTLRDFFNHTSCHANEPGLSAIQRSISESIAKNNSLQNYYLDTVSSFGRDIVQPSFKCDCCDTIFSNRDSYAMHVMMRVKNREQKGVNMLIESSTANISDLPDKKDNSSPASDISASDLNQAYYIDVTSIAEKDEYLKTVLDDQTEKTKSNGNIMASILVSNTLKCSQCDKVCSDQDSLAMHVMSCHTEQQTTASSSDKRIQQMSSSVSPLFPHTLFSDYSSSNGSIVSHRVDGNLYCEYCGMSCSNRDNLAMHILSHTLKKPLKYKSESHNNSKGECSTTIPDCKSSVETSTSKAYKLDLQSQPLNLTSVKQPGISPLSGPKSNLYVDICHKRGTVNQKVYSKENTPEKVPNVRSTSVDPPSINGNSGVFRGMKKAFYRSSSLPDLSERNLVPVMRSASVGTVDNDQFNYIIKDEQFYDSDYSNIGVDLTTEKKEQVSEPKTSTYTDEGRRTVEMKQDRCPEGPTSDEIDDPRKLLHYIDKPVYICRFCGIIFLNHTLYYLHKGLHNVNNPWQCNMCGKVCANVHDFSAHVIHI